MRTQAAVRAEKEARAIADRQMNDAEAARIEIDILKADRDYPRHSAALSPLAAPKGYVLVDEVLFQTILKHQTPEQGRAVCWDEAMRVFRRADDSDKERT